MVIKSTEPVVLTPDMIKGLELAAYICRMYADGNRWAEAILSKGDQDRALFWMGKGRVA